MNLHYYYSYFKIGLDFILIPYELLLKSLPLKCDKFEQRFKGVYEKSLELIEKIPNFSRISKTRGTNNQEPIKIEIAL